MVEGLHQSRTDQSLGVHDGRRKTAEFIQRHAVGVGGVDHDLALPVRGLGELIVQPGRDSQDNNLGPERVLQRMRGHRRPDSRRSRCDSLRWPSGRHGDLKVFAGERAGNRLANGAKTNNHRAHEILRIAF
jgi:hypothetical protein